MTAFDLFREHGTGAVSDALDLLGLNGGLLGLAHRSGTGVTCGLAYTLRYEPVAAGGHGPAGEFIALGVPLREARQRHGYNLAAVSASGQA